MSAGRAYFRGFYPSMNISAITTFPLNNLIFLKDSSIDYIFKKFSVSFLMFFFYFSNLLIDMGNFIKTLFLGYF